MKRLPILALGVAALAAIQSCSEEPGLYLSGPPGAAAQIHVTNSKVILMIGDSAVVGVRAEDAVGNPTADAVTLSSCDASTAITSQSSTQEWTTQAYIKGTGLGSSCVVAQAAGLSDTIRTSVGPAGMTIAGDPIVGYDSQDPTANGPFAFTLNAVDASGTVLTGTADYVWSSSDNGKFIVDQTDGTIIQTKSLGQAQLRVVAPGGANADLTITIGAPLFTGTASTNSGAPGDFVTLTRAAGKPAFDAGVTAGFGFGALSTFVDTWTADNITAVVPGIGVVGRSDLVISNYGPNSVNRRAIFNSTTASLLDKYSPGNTDNACAIPGTIPVFENVKSPGGAVYIVHDGATQGTGSCLDAGGDGYDHWFTFTTGATGVTSIVATWKLEGDYDLVVCDTPAKVAANGACSYGYSGNSFDETMNGLALAANTQYWFAFEVWDGNAGTNFAKIVVTTN